MKNKFIVVFVIISFSILYTHSVLAADKTPEQLVAKARNQVSSVSIHDVKKMIDAEENVIILDVRDKEEYEKGHIPEAIHISRGLLEFMVADKIPDKNAKIVVY